MSSESSENPVTSTPLPSQAETPTPTPPASRSSNGTNQKPEYTLETLESNSNSSFNSSQYNDDFIAMNQSNLSSCGLEHRDGYTVLSPILSSAPSVASSTFNFNPSNNFNSPILNSMPTYSPNSILEPNSPFGEPQSCCLECGAYAVLQKCKAHCNLDICDDCKQKHWQFEVDDLLKMKTHLEDNIIELKNYLSAKKSQCNENVRNSQQIKRFINMTMNQIRRKVDLELENKRDELFSSVESFCDNQKKLGTSVNEDSFQSAERVCDEIENLLLNTENNVNLIKANSLKTYARSCNQKMQQQKGSRIPFYSIFFVPDSSIQVNNSFGKIVLKSYNPDAGAELTTTTLEDGQIFDETYFNTPLPQSNDQFNFDEVFNQQQQAPPPQPQYQKQQAQQFPTQYQPQQYQTAPQFQPQPQYQYQPQHQPQQQQQVPQLPSRPPPQLSFTPKYNPLKTTSSPTTPPAPTISETKTEMDQRREQYQNKYYSQKASSPQKSEGGSFISKRTTNVYASQLPTNYAAPTEYSVNMPEIKSPSKFQGTNQPYVNQQPKQQPKPEPKPEPKQEPKQEPKPEPKPEPKQEPKPEPKPEPKQQPKIEPKPQPKVIVEAELVPPPLPLTPPPSEPSQRVSKSIPFTYSPAKPDIKTDDSFFDDIKSEPGTFSYFSESEDGDLDNTKYTDITISNIQTPIISSPEDNQPDLGHFEDVFIRTPIKSQDLKLDPRPILQTPSDSNGIREIKVIHTASPRIGKINGIKRFTNFQNSTSSSFDKSDLFTSSGSESGGSQNSQVSAKLMQKSFKQQLMFNNQTNQQTVGTAKLVNTS